MSKNIPRTQLQALPDFSLFQFTTEEQAEAAVRHVHFSHHQDDRIYDLDLTYSQAEPDDDTIPIAGEEERDRLIATLVLIIEVYAERYPTRIIRIKGDCQSKAQLYRAVLDKYWKLLCSQFLIDLEETYAAADKERDINSIAFLLTKKPDTHLSIQTLHTVWIGRSRLFDQRVMIELKRSIRVGLALPAV